MVLRAVLEDSEMFEFQATQFVVTFLQPVQIVVDRASPALEGVVSVHVFP